MTPDQLRELLEKHYLDGHFSQAEYDQLRLVPELWEAADDLFSERETTARWHRLRNALAALEGAK